jgi:hypothetical protein
LEWAVGPRNPMKKWRKHFCLPRRQSCRRLALHPLPRTRGRCFFDPVHSRPSLCRLRVRVGRTHECECEPDFRNCSEPLRAARSKQLPERILPPGIDRSQHCRQVSGLGVMRPSAANIIWLSGRLLKQPASFEQMYGKCQSVIRRDPAFTACGVCRLPLAGKLFGPVRRAACGSHHDMQKDSSAVPGTAKTAGAIN